MYFASIFDTIYSSFYSFNLVLTALMCAQWWSTVQYSTVQYSTVQYSTVQYRVRASLSLCCLATPKTHRQGQSRKRRVNNTD